jgi:hypothetical protein
MTWQIKHISLLFALSLGMAVSRCTAADWPAITPDEKSMTNVPQQPDAPAVILYREDTTDDTKNFHTVYVRLKVLTEAGRKYADVEIPVGRSPFTISQLSGRTVHADGQVIPFEDQPVDQLVVQKGVSEVTSQLLAAGDSPEVKVQKIYAAISQMDDLSLAIPPNPGAAPKSSAAEDVLQARSGTHDELNRLFVAMVRAAGIPAMMMWLPDRGQKVFDANLMNTDQLDAEVAIVQLGGQDVFLDPGTRFCPYGVLNWHYAGTRGLRQGGNGVTTLADSPAPTYAQAKIQRVARLQLTDKGAMDGTLAVGFSGQEAMVRRQQGANLSADARKNLLEDEIRTSLPGGTQVTLTNVPEWDKTEGMLVAKFKVAGQPANRNGQGWVVPLDVFEASEKPLFPLAQRTSPIYFDYAWRQVDEVHIVLPANVEVGNLPANQEARTGYAMYRTERKHEGANGIVASRDMAINGVLFAPAEYKELKDFYDKVAVGDEQTVVLKGSLRPLAN